MSEARQERDSLLPVWQLRRTTLRLRQRPLLMGIVNVTPDSFSDGGHYLEPEAAVARALKLEAEGADILDLGGESTRPGAEPVDADEELRRVVPVLERLRGKVKTPISIDTTKAVVAEAALAAGAEIVNDISALTADPRMIEVVTDARCGVCMMHMQGNPQTMQQNPHYDNVVDEVLAYLRYVRDRLTAAGIAREQVALDPGIGFGKTLEHNLALLRHLGRFHSLGCPLVVGPSRKRFIGEVLGDMNADRTAGTLGVCAALARQGVDVLRVHDVGATARMLKLYRAVDSCHRR